MNIRTAVLTIVYTVLSSVLNGFVINAVVPEVFADTKKLATLLAVAAAKDVYLLLKDVGFQKVLGIYTPKGEDK